MSTRLLHSLSFFRNEVQTCYLCFWFKYNLDKDKTFLSDLRRKHFVNDNRLLTVNTLTNNAVFTFRKRLNKLLTNIKKDIALQKNLSKSFFCNDDTVLCFYDTLIHFLTCGIKNNKFWILQNVFMMRQKQKNLKTRVLNSFLTYRHFRPNLDHCLSLIFH